MIEGPPLSQQDLADIERDFPNDPPLTSQERAASHKSTETSTAQPAHEVIPPSENSESDTKAIQEALKSNHSLFKPDLVVIALGNHDGQVFRDKQIPHQVRNAINYLNTPQTDDPFSTWEFKQYHNQVLATFEYWVRYPETKPTTEPKVSLLKKAFMNWTGYYPLSWQSNTTGEMVSADEPTGKSPIPFEDHI